MLNDTFLTTLNVYTFHKLPLVSPIQIIIFRSFWWSRLIRNYLSVPLFEKRIPYHHAHSSAKLQNPSPFLIPNFLTITSTLAVKVFYYTFNMIIEVFCYDYYFLLTQTSNNIDEYRWISLTILMKFLELIILTIVFTALLGINWDDWNNGPLSQYLNCNYSITNLTYINN